MPDKKDLRYSFSYDGHALR